MVITMRRTNDLRDHNNKNSSWWLILSLLNSPLVILLKVLHGLQWIYGVIRHSIVGDYDKIEYDGEAAFGLFLAVLFTILIIIGVE